MKFRSIFISTLALLLTTAAYMHTNTAEAASIDFSDIPTTYPTYKEITDLVNRGVINGYTDGTFRPTNQVNRAEFATFIARALDLPSATSNFKDVPKTAALYDGVSKAYKAGIIKGFSDGSFKPNTAVNRQDMAVMLDRAMQLKGTYTQRKALNFSDTSKVGAYAKTSVERMYNYNVMGAYSGSNFSPTTIGTRAETAKFIYNMLIVVEGGTIDTPPTSPATNAEIEAIKKKNPLDLTHVEIVKAYGPYVIARRFDTFGEVRGIQQWDIWEEVYMNYLSNAKKYAYTKVLKPNEWLEEEKDVEFGLLANLFGEVRGNYPDYEIISVNGEPFLNSNLMFGNNLKNYTSFSQTEIGSLHPKVPVSDGEFKVDIHYKKNDFATYYSNVVKLGKQTILPYTKDNKSLMVEMKSVFSQVNGIKFTTNSISYGNKTVSFTNGSTVIKVNDETQNLSVAPELKNGVQMIPIRDVATHLGLTTRVASGYFGKIEIQNYTEQDSFSIFK